MLFILLLLISGNGIALRAQQNGRVYYSVIPQPRIVKPAPGDFNIKTQINICPDIRDSIFLDSIRYMPAFILSDYFENIRYPDTCPSDNYIVIRKAPVEDTDNSSAYHIKIRRKKILLEAPNEKGIFYGLQTLGQIIAGRRAINSYYIPAGDIIDWPEYEYRGMMLDVARHFFDENQIRYLIDYLARFKINKLHLHLTDDQGWRIEIKSYPELTRRGALIEVDSTPGGYFTQKQYSDLVAYARNRYIEIIPEIDMPGHTNAALASYAFLNCDNKRRELYSGTGVGFSSLCTSKDTVYGFVNRVIGELAAISPSPYIHIGGDESNATPHNEYIRFIDSVEKIVRSHGKTMIGWDEIARAHPDSGTVVQFWIHKNEAVKASQSGHPLIYSYAPYMYLDMKYNKRTPIGLHWAGYINLKKAYTKTLEPVDSLDINKFIGIEAPLWTETIRNMRDLIYMTFPRICAYAEAGWTPRKERNWRPFRIRLSLIQKLLPPGFYKDKSVPWRYPEKHKLLSD
ncbi:MAG: family 20 glycosylhydrolase [Chlorobi bacterium]|nr:family 20 glycosylhydrolase [Chlorobiota bacterium]